MRIYGSGTPVKPQNNDEGYDVLIDTWKTNKTKIIVWINNSFKHSISSQLAKVWDNKGNMGQDHLQRLFTQSNFAKQYQLKNHILLKRRVWVFKSFILLR